MAPTEAACVFCEIVAGRAPARRVYENAHAVVVLDIQPFTEGHCLVVSKRHVPFWHGLKADESAGLFEAAHVVANRMAERLKPDFVCTYARGRRIPHTHIFLVPSFGGDVLDRFFNALEGVQESPDRLAALKRPDSLEAAARLLRDEG